jgi:hypothetical protein
MSLNRKQLVLTAFERLDPNETGVLKVDDVLHNFDFSALPAVADGLLTPDEAASEMLESFENGGDIEGKVTWAEFLDYFAGMSLAIDDGDYFELMVRNALKPSGPSPSKRFAATHATARRVKVTFNDGKQQVVEVADEDIEAAQFSADAIIDKLNSRGVRGVAEIQILK